MLTLSRPWLRFYEEGVPADVEVPAYPIYTLLQESARRFPTNDALVLVVREPRTFDHRITYAELDDLTNRFAAALRARGVGHGDRVAVMLPNVPQYVIAAYGIWKAGGVLVQVNPLYRGQDLSFVLRDSSARHLVALSRFLPHIQEVLPQTAVETLILSGIHDFFPTPFRLLYGLLKAKKEGDAIPRAANVVAFRDLLKSPPAAPADVAAGELAILQYTGGTTGKAKGAMLSHRNMVANVAQMRTWLVDLREGEERVLSVVPFFHVYGMTVCMNLAVSVAAGNIMVLMPGFIPRLVAETAHKYRPTIFPGAPAIYNAINQLKDIEKYDLRSIRACVSGAAPMPEEVQRRFEELTGARVVEGFGLSEASPVTHANPIYGTRKIRSIGLPLPSTEAKIVDAETGHHDLAVDEVGELAIRGPQVMMGYWNQPEETAIALRGGWLFTGDIARVDADGFFFIEDRKKDMVNIGGLKVFPREVEEALYRHPKVREAVVVGVASKLRGEMLVAHVVPQDGGEPRELKRELRRFLAEQLAPYKVPRRIEVVTEIPKTLGIPKALRRVVREQEQERADAPDEEPEAEPSVADGEDAVV